jgi:threonine dehydrogenase-like Zn-dependent dehydrogenase
VGDRVTGLPFTHSHDGPACIGLSPFHSGGLATLSCIDAERTFRVPEGIPDDLAALTEPLSVGLHAVNLANRNDGPNMVIGCGPVGLAVILALKIAGRGPILAADFSAERRAVAASLGADIVLDPATDSPYERWDDLGHEPAVMSPLLERGFPRPAAGPQHFRMYRRAGCSRPDREIGAGARACRHCRRLSA